VESDLTFIVHPTEDVLEEYAFNRLSEAETRLAEEHLLVCSACQKTLQELDEYIVLMKAATAGLDENRPAEPPAGKSVSWEQVGAWLIGLGPVPVTVWALVLGLVCISALASRSGPRFPTNPTPVAVSLIALRGEGIATLVPAGATLDLAIDMTGLPAASSYRLEAVNGTGQPVWEGQAVAANGKLVAQMSKKLKLGIYWVRLYADGELLREFGLNVGNG